MVKFYNDWSSFNTVGEVSLYAVEMSFSMIEVKNITIFGGKAQKALFIAEI